MSIKEENEITIKVICSNAELIKLLTNKDFKEGEKFTLDDYYLIPRNLDIENLTTREILAKAIIIRYIVDNDKIELALKFIENSNTLIELETNNNFNTIDKLKKLVSELEIPIEENNYFVKKAEDKLNKILNRK